MVIRALPFRHALLALGGWRIPACLIVLAGLTACGSAAPPPLPQGYGLASTDRNLLTRPRPGLTPEQRLEWSVGRSFANQPWVAPPSTTTARDGLGPLFNANSCAACHRRNGQGQLPPKGPGLILVLKGPSAEADTNHNLGEQLQDRALPDLPPEGQIAWQQRHFPDTMPPRSARQYVIQGDETRPVSARLAPALVGLGLLNRVSDDTLLALSDPDDRDGDGISGRVNLVWDPRQQRLRPGRFGWKASQPDLTQQIALAFSQDMGIVSTLYPVPLYPTRLHGTSRPPPAACPQPARDHACPPGATPEINDKLLAAVTDYVANLAIPAPSPLSTGSARPEGQALFSTLGCQACHQPSLAAELPDRGRVVFQAFTDLLLHDMGSGLADAIDAYSASGAEWRTAPLWGLGLRTREADNTRLLHDGRAASIHEAIVWHGGEALPSRQRYLALTEQQQHALVTFLKAL